MKVAVSIPDPIFEEAETLARRLKTSRSEIYARALAEFVGEHAPDRVTETINQVVDSIGASSDRQFTREASRRLLTNVEW